MERERDGMEKGCCLVSCGAVGLPPAVGLVDVVSFQPQHLMWNMVGAFK